MEGIGDNASEGGRVGDLGVSIIGVGVGDLGVSIITVGVAPTEVNRSEFETEARGDNHWPNAGMRATAAMITPMIVAIAAIDCSFDM